MDDFDIDIDGADFWGNGDYGRGRRGCGCVAIVAGFVLFFIVFVWLLSHKKQVELALVFGLVGAAGYFGRGYLYSLLNRPKKRVRGGGGSLPTPLADVKVGQPTHAAGLVGMTTPPQHAPLGAPPCVFFRIIVEAIGHPGVIFEGRSADELLLEDGMGAKLLVRLDGAKWLVKRSHDLVSSPEVPDPAVVTYLAERGIHVDRPVQARVEWIAPHELVFVRGIPHEAGSTGESTYRTSEAAPPLELVSTPQQPVLISLEPI